MNLKLNCFTGETCFVSFVLPEYIQVEQNLDGNLCKNIPDAADREPNIDRKSILQFWGPTK